MTAGAGPRERGSVIRAWYSSRPSSAILLVAVYFGVKGAVQLAAAVYRARQLVLGSEFTPGLIGGELLTTGALAVLGVAWIWIGWLLWHRRRAGAVLGLASLGAAAVYWVGWATPPLSELLFVAVAVALILLAWGDFR